MNEKKTKTKKKQVTKKTSFKNLKKMEIPETPANIPVEEQFDFGIKGSAPVTVGRDNKIVNSSTLRKVNVPRDSGQFNSLKKKRKPSLNLKVIKQNRKLFS